MSTVEYRTDVQAAIRTRLYQFKPFQFNSFYLRHINSNFFNTKDDNTM